MPEPKRSSLLCPNCRKLISADEPRCPYCGTSRPAAPWRNNPWTRGLGREETLVNWVISLNVGMFILSLLLNPTGTRVSLNPLTALAPSDLSLLHLGATGTIPIDRLHRWWSLLSANYLHGGILHIVFNMLAFRQLAPFVIREYGPYRMISLYTLSGVGGFLVSYLAGVALTIGASAAVCGLIGAALFYGKNRGGAYGQAVYKQVSGWVVGLFIFGLLVPGINNWGHGGGLVGGALLGYLLGYRERRPETLFHKSLAGICAALTVLTLGWAALSALFLRFAA